MKVDNNYNYAPNFQARLDLRGIKGLKLDEKKMQQVADGFEKVTKHYKNGIMDLGIGEINREDGTVLHNVEIYSDAKNVAYFPSLQEFTDWFKKLSPKEIYKNLARIYEFQKLKTKNMAVETLIQRNIDHTDFSLTKNTGLAKLFKKDNNEALHQVYSTLAKNNKSRLYKLTQQLEETKANNKKLENEVLKGIDAPIEIDTLLL